MNFYCYDGNGNVGELIDESGIIVGHYEYDAFGRTVKAVGALASENKFRFSTKYWETETELYYYGYRFYSAELGRWLNRDPIGEELFYNKLSSYPHKDNYIDFNLYLFVLNSPIHLIDLFGLSTIIINYDTGAIGAHSAALSYKQTLSKFGYNVVLLEGNGDVVLCSYSQYSDFKGLIVIGHGFYNHSNLLDVDDLRKMRPIDGYELLALQSCRSEELVVNSLTGLMADNGLAIVNIGYSSVIGMDVLYNSVIQNWSLGKDVGFDHGYRLKMYYNAIIDIVERPIVFLQGFKQNVDTESFRKKNKFN
ncbi:MAG: RHS repeat-associated core domain-containing protein [Desulfobacterales bacterium]|nr:RHS repeat-associated core domain-containing protein [Desulfobacterales bacterium]